MNNPEDMNNRENGGNRDNQMGDDVCRYVCQNLCGYYALLRRERDQLLAHYDLAVLRIRNATAAAWATIGAILDGENRPWRYLVEQFQAPPDGHPIAHLWTDPCDQPSTVDADEDAEGYDDGYADGYTDGYADANTDANTDESANGGGGE